MTMTNDKLPTAQEAMASAVFLASREGVTPLDLDQARTWILIAAELRAGYVPPVGPSQLIQDGPTDLEIDIQRKDVDETKLLDYGQRMQDAPDDRVGSLVSLEQEAEDAALDEIVKKLGEAEPEPDGTKRITFRDDALNGTMDSLKEVDARRVTPKDDADTVIIDDFLRVGGYVPSEAIGLKCVNCHYPVAWAVLNGETPQVIHLVSRQRVCPVRGKNSMGMDVHMYATVDPESVDREGP